MNKDKLKKEVRDYLRFSLNGGGIVSCNLEELLLHFAEPREKRIAELENENAELKLKLEALDGQTPWKDIKDKSEVIGQLTKAKEIIKRYLTIGVGGKITQNYLDVTKEAEQFLKETEK